MNKGILGLATALSIAALPIAVPTHAADSDPTYRVTVTRGSPDSGTYTAHITLENLTAAYGTFGLKYDNTLFDFTPADVTIADGLTLKYTPEELTGTEWADSGYYIFVWQAGGYDETVLDASEAAKEIADFTFTLKPTASADDLTLESITVMPWQKTREAKAFASGLPPNSPIQDTDGYFSEYWRWTDEANDVPERGRLAREKATIHGIDKRGFYEAAVNAGLGDEDGELSYFYDVKTVVDYVNLDIKYSVLQFYVIDKETGEDIENAAVNVYRADSPLGEKQTDFMGEASYAADITESAEYSYTVIKDGYLPVPLTGGTMPTVTTTAGESTLVTVELERGYTLRGYVDLGQGSGMSGDVLTGADVTFERADGKQSAVQTTAERNDAYFEAFLPKGAYTVTVTKPGYVRYVITNFDFSPVSELTIFAEGKKITPYIGSAKTGASVSLLDAAAIKAEMREGAAQLCGDVDNNGRVDATDMAYVMFNYGKRTVMETYAEFLTSPQPETP